VKQVSDLASEREIHEFFSFSGEIEHIEIQRYLISISISSIVYQSLDSWIFVFTYLIFVSKSVCLLRKIRERSRKLKYLLALVFFFSSYFIFLFG
jgi:hypothetical protein